MPHYDEIQIGVSFMAIIRERGKVLYRVFPHISLAESERVGVGEAVTPVVVHYDEIALRSKIITDKILSTGMLDHAVYNLQNSFRIAARRVLRNGDLFTVMRGKSNPFHIHTSLIFFRLSFFLTSFFKHHKRSV